MKYLISILSIFISFHAESQKTNKKSAPEPTYFLDSIRIGKIAIFDPNKIESVNEVNDDDTTKEGKFTLSLKILMILTFYQHRTLPSLII